MFFLCLSPTRYEFNFPEYDVIIYTKFVSRGAPSSMWLQRLLTLEWTIDRPVSVRKHVRMPPYTYTISERT